MTQAAAVSLDERLTALKKERGETVALDEVAAILRSLAPTLGSGDGNGNATRLCGLVETLGQAEQELTNLQPRTLSERHIAEACAELDAVVAHTETAAGQFMDVADRLSTLAESLDGEAKDRLSGISTEILETAAFQDITGQRISKVLGVLRLIDQRLGALADSIGDTVAEDAPAEVFDSEGNVVDTAALTHGPQQEGEGNSQDDIDAILAAFD